MCSCQCITRIYFSACQMQLCISCRRTALRSSTFSVFTEFNKKVQLIYIDFCNPVASVIWDWDWVKYPFLKAWHMSIWCFVVQMATVSLWHFIFLGKQLVIFLLGVRHLSHIESSRLKLSKVFRSLNLIIKLIYFCNNKRQKLLIWHIFLLLVHNFLNQILLFVRK